MTAAFLPRPLDHVYHHIWSFGCGTPGSVPKTQTASPYIWDCGKQVYPEDKYQEGLDAGTICRNDGVFRHLFSFEGRDKYNINFTMSDGVGIPIGGDTGINFIVMGVHFIRLSDLPGGWTGHPGMTFRIESSGITKRAAKFSLLVWGSVEGKTVKSLEGGFTIPDGYTVHPFAIGVHTHAMGIDTQIFRVTADNQTTTIYHEDPRESKTAHAIDKEITLNPGDKFIARCTYENTSPIKVRVE